MNTMTEEILNLITTTEPPKSKEHACAQSWKLQLREGNEIQYCVCIEPITCEYYVSLFSVMSVWNPDMIVFVPG